jgi:hypothetical protein
LGSVEFSSVTLVVSAGLFSSGGDGALSSGLGSGVGAGVALASVDFVNFELLPDELRFFAELAVGFLADPDFDLAVAPCPLVSMRMGNSTKPRIIRKFETLNIGREK